MLTELLGQEVNVLKLRTPQREQQTVLDQQLSILKLATKSVEHTAYEEDSEKLSVLSWYAL